MMDIMENAEFQTQLTSIMETLAKTAVVEISKLFADNSSYLRVEISRFSSENESLKKKCRFLESELQSSRKTAGNMNGTEAPLSRTGLTETGHRPEIDNVFGKEWCMNLWRHEESKSGEQEDAHLDSSVITGEPVDLLEEEQNMVMIKEESFDDCSSETNEEDHDNPSVKVVIQDEIRKILPELDSKIVQNVVNHLWFAVGVEKTEDLSLVEVSDLKDLMEPIQCRKLVKTFRQRGVVSAASSPSMAYTCNQQSFKKIKLDSKHSSSVGSASQTGPTQSLHADVLTSDQTSVFSTSAISPPSTTSSHCSSVMSSIETQDTSNSQKHTSQLIHQGVILPDISLNPVSMTEEKKLYLASAGQDGNPRPDRFAALLFKSLVPHKVYLDWSGTVNFNGTRSKNALPNNLRAEIADAVRRKFPDNKLSDWNKIKDRLNELLRKRRLTFPLT